MSSALSKYIERRFLNWLKSRPQGKITLWNAYLAGYADGFEHCKTESKKEMDKLTEFYRVGDVI